MRAIKIIILSPILSESVTNPDDDISEREIINSLSQFRFCKNFITDVRIYDIQARQMLFNINYNIFNILDIFYKYVKFWTIKKFVDRISFSTSTSKQCHPWFQFCLYSRAENTFYEEYIYLDTVERTGGINTTRPLRLLFLLETSNLSRLILEAKWASRKTGRVSTDWPTCGVRSQLEQKGGGGMN